MTINKIVRLFCFILIFIVACTSSARHDVGIFKNGVLLKDKALAFLKKTSKLQFHVNSSQKLAQDFSILSDTYLKNNIELSYQASLPLIQKGLISEFSFANYVLPYKVNGSIPNDWKSQALGLQTVDEKDKKKCSDTRSVLALCARIDKYAKSLIQYKQAAVNENLSTLQDILKRGEGSCLSICDLTSYLCRANGFPVTFDYVPAWGNMDGGHSWSVFVPNQNEFYPVAPLEPNGKDVNPLFILASKNKETFSSRIPPKIYRRGFIPDTSSVYLKHHTVLANIGTSFTDLDVTDQYVKTIDFDTKSALKNPGDILLLSVFNTGSWVPVAAISPKDRVSKFKAIGVENLYLVSSPNYQKNLYLFYVTKSGEVLRFSSEGKKQITIDRDKSIVKEQLDYSNKYGWDFPDSILNLSIKATPNLFDNLAYEIHGLVNGQWKLLETQRPKNRTIVSSSAYPDGLYLLIEKGKQITPKNRPFAFVKGKAISI